MSSPLEWSFTSQHHVASPWRPASLGNSVSPNKRKRSIVWKAIKLQHNECFSHCGTKAVWSLLMCLCTKERRRLSWHLTCFITSLCSSSHMDSVDRRSGCIFHIHMPVEMYIIYYTRKLLTSVPKRKLTTASPKYYDKYCSTL